MLMQIRVWNPDGTWMNAFSFHECDDVELDELFKIDCALEFDAAELTVGVTVRPATRGGFDVTVDTPDGWSVSRESDLP
ncbi:MAG TPA: hypothetical protein VEA69_18140 [Tepidisphaeraceae bacterium]|nr:hypothetical protein [Tepidisphaeraceae bacterium]